MHGKSEGLSSKAVLALFEKYGPNVLPEQKSKPWFQILFDQFKSFLVALLFFAGGVSLLLGDFLDSVFILAIVILNALIGFFQEIKAKKEIEALKKMVVPVCRVVRDGKEVQIPTKSIVPGDLVILSEGDHIPADGEIVEISNLSVSEAALTGESVPVEKDVGEMAYMATIVLSGRAKLKVLTIGKDTKFGKIATELSTISDEKSPLEIKINNLGNKLAVAAIGIISIIALIGFWQKREIADLFFSSVALAVAAIPEGLPAVLSIAMAVGARRLAAQKAIVKRLPVTEALGSVDVICTDKTGTLTKNEMVVRRILMANGRNYEVSGVGYKTEGKIEGDLEENEFKQLLMNCVLCNGSTLAQVEDGGVSFTVLGDTTEGALLVLAKKAGFDFEEIRQEHPLVSEISFTSERKMMSVATKETVFSKGAPEKIIQICANLTGQKKEELIIASKKLGAQGLRVLAFASKAMDASEPEKDLNFLGLVAIYDAPREEVAGAIKICKEAGVTPVMITGDSLETARAIAEQIGLVEPGEEIITGEQLALYSDEVLEKNLENIRVFARVSPSDKLRIVEAFQRLGKIVAVTGDGVNDAPALKKAHVGVAMGISGTDVAKEASDIIITDDNFATIIKAIEEGRAISLNLGKAIKYLLICNLGEVAAVFICIAANLPLPFSPLAILWMNVVTDGLPALALAVDPKEEKLLKNHKHNLGIGQNFLGRSAISEIGIFGIGIGIATVALFAVLSRGNLESARMIAFSFIVVLELGMAFWVRKRAGGIFGNRLLIFSVAAAIALQIIIIVVPQIREIFL